MNENMSNKRIKEGRRQNVSIILNNLNNINSLSDFGSSIFSS